MTLPDLTAALTALHQRHERVRGRRVNSFALELHEDGTGCLIALVSAFTPAGAMLEDGEVIAPFESLGVLAKLLDGSLVPGWRYHDETVSSIT